MMKRILMVDYYGTCNNEGEPIGHSPKVLREYTDLLENDYCISVAISPCLEGKIREEDYEEIIILPYDIVEEGKKGLRVRIIDKFKLFRNIDKAMKEKNKYDIVWFYRSDFFLFLNFFLRQKNNKISPYALVYQQIFCTGIVGKILSWIYNKSIRKFDGIIYTQKSAAPNHSHKLYIPDYYYDEGKYGRYRGIEKSRKAVCLGTMSPYKKLEDLIETFNNLGYPLEIAGYFFEEGRYQDLCRKAKPNVTVQNVILSEDDYYRKLAGARFAVLPYDMQQYQNRTSGVLQECLFLNTIPIAPAGLLKNNDIDGYGYERLSQLKVEELDRYSVKEQDLKQFDKNYIKGKLCNFFV